MNISQKAGGIFMNYSLFEKLCKNNKTNPTALSKKIGLSKGNTSNWKNGGNPSVDILCKIADELNCTTDALLGREENQTVTLKNDEQELLENYRQLAPNEKEEASKRVQELVTQNTSIKEYKNKSLILHSNISKINGYENRLLNAFRTLSYEEQIELTVKIEIMSEKSKTEENVG